MSKYITEFVGTFFLILSIGLSGGLPLPPFAIGFTLMAMVYMGGHRSGAMYNPAVSLGVFLRGKMTVKGMLLYWVVQIAGATAAAAMVYAIAGESFAPAPGNNVPVLSALLVEVLYTFALVLVILNVATAKATEGNSFYGAAIGLTITAAAFAGGPISGGAFNPAVGIGPTIIHTLLGNGTWRHVWLYIVGPMIGGALAAGVFRLQEATQD